MVGKLFLKRLAYISSPRSLSSSFLPPRPVEACHEYKRHPAQYPAPTHIAVLRIFYGTRRFVGQKTIEGI